MISTPHIIGLKIIQKPTNPKNYCANREKHPNIVRCVCTGHTSIHPKCMLQINSYDIKFATCHPQVEGVPYVALTSREKPIILITSTIVPVPINYKIHLWNVPTVRSHFPLKTTCTST